MPNAAKWPADNVERRPIDKLIPYAANSRTHTDAQVDQIAASIREWGWTMPVLIDTKGTIIAGHARVMAAKKLGLDEVPVMVAKGWTDAQRRAYVIADNKLALNAGWDDEMLRAEFIGLDNLDFDLSLIGFDEDELSNIFLPREIGETDPDAEWQGMPEFENEDKTAFRSIVVHLKDNQSVNDFAQMIGQTITPKTKFVWFPEIEIETYANKAYQNDETAA